MRQLLFIRHGESEANKLEICAGHIDVPLTELGRQQAHTAGAELSNGGAKVDLIISSPLIRAFDTAVIIAEEIGYPVERIQKTELAREQYRGDLEGKPSYLQKGMSPEGFAQHGAESDEAMDRRARELIEYLSDQNVETVLLVSHNQFGRRFVALYTGQTLDAIGKLPNAHVLELSS